MNKLVLSVLITLIYFLSFQSIQAQSVCSDVLDQGAGFENGIESVVYKGLNSNNEPSDTIILRIENDGCTETGCNSLIQYDVKAIMYKVKLVHW